jgi:hypothetical protein
LRAESKLTKSATLGHRYRAFRTTNIAPTTLKQQANPLLSMNNHAPLVICGNEKNKQLTLLSQRKLALTARNTLFGMPKS